jgi:hypothetical protein
MKILILRKKNIISFSISGVLVLICAAGAFYTFRQKNTLKDKIEAIGSEASKIRSEASDLESKTTELKKYKKLWSSLTDNRKITTGIKMDDINSKLATLAEKYAITNQTIKVTLPETMKGSLFERSTITVTSATGSLNFQALNDVKALSFIEEFINSFPGYVVVTGAQIRKGDKNYTTEDLITISTGKGVGLINAKVDFVWYAFRGKDAEIKKPVDINAKPGEIKPNSATPNAQPTL